jgi:hypothetical protein
LWVGRGGGGECEGEDGSGAGASEGSGADVHGGSGGDDVVDEEDGAAVDVARPADAEGVAEVIAPLGRGEADLVRGVPDAAEASVEEGHAESAGDGSAEDVGLVEAALEPAQWVEGHGQDGVDLEEGVGEGVEPAGEESGEEPSELGVAIVFELADESGQGGEVEVGGAGEAEGGGACVAARAEAALRGGAGASAAGAGVVIGPVEPADALVAEEVGGLGGAAADAEPGKEEVGESCAGFGDHSLVS